MAHAFAYGGVRFLLVASIEPKYEIYDRPAGKEIWEDILRFMGHTKSMSGGVLE